MDDLDLNRANDRLLARRAGLAPPPAGAAPDLARVLAHGATLALPESDGPASPTVVHLPSTPGSLRTVRWENLAELVGPEGRPALGSVESEGGRLLTGHAAVAELRRRLARTTNAVLLGETGSGKTISAAAWMDEQTDRVDRARWVRSSDLANPAAFARALGAHSLVVDNLGWELAGAPPGSPLAAMRAGPVIEWFDRWGLRAPRGQRLVVTTWLSFDAMSSAYNGGLARRVYEGATVIRFGVQ